MFLLNVTCVLWMTLAGSAQPKVAAVSGRVVGLGGDAVIALSCPKVTLIAVEGFNQPVLGKIAETAAGLDGCFHFEGVLPGVYFLRAETPGFVTTESQLVRVPAGQTTNVDLCQKVGFEVISSKDMMELSGTVRSGQRPLGDATVNISVLPLSQGVQQLRTDSNGRYGPVLVTPGDQVVTVFKPGYEYEFRVVKSGTKRVVDFQLSRSDD